MDTSWFYTALATLRVMERVSKGEEFPPEFCKEAFLEANKQTIVEESPHPYVDVVLHRPVRTSQSCLSNNHILLLFVVILVVCV